LEALITAGLHRRYARSPGRWSDECSSQWTPWHPELMVEVPFDHVSGGRFRHGARLPRPRPGKAPGQRRKNQIA